jgi:hypothetical protein
VDDAALTAVIGNVHRFADRRMPAPGILGGGSRGVPAGGGLAGAVPADQRADHPRSHLGFRGSRDAAGRSRAQRDWDRIIVPIAVLQGLAVIALCVRLIG